MTRFKLTSFHLGLCLGSFALLAACGGRKDDSDDTSGGSSSTGGASSTDPTVPTEGGTSASSTTDATAGSQTDSDPTNPTTTLPDTTATTGGIECADPAPLPNNMACNDASGCGCESGLCFVVPALGGFCGECKVDADCKDVTGGGCTVPNPIAGIGSTCNTGEAGAGCETNDICTDPAAGFCGLLLSVPGIINVSTCGACAINDDCVAANPKTPNCSPTYDVMNFSGQYVCVEDASVPNNGGCNLAKDAMDLPVGNAACESGFCGEASVMGLVKLGICGECNSNADCVAMGKQTCTDPVVDLQGATLQGSICM